MPAYRAGVEIQLRPLARLPAALGAGDVGGQVKDFYFVAYIAALGALLRADAAPLIDRVGSIAKGKNANLVIIDDMVNVEKVIFEGEIQ